MSPRLILALAAGLAATAVAHPGRAADWRVYAGTWIITGAATAPWSDATRAPDLHESRRMIGKPVTFGAGRIAGPRPLGCAKPVYKVDVVGPDMIFEGMLAEKAGPLAGGAEAAQAAALKLGFGDPAHIPTLDAGCTEVQFHALRAGVLVFALNNRVYTMVRR